MYTLTDTLWFHIPSGHYCNSLLLSTELGVDGNDTICVLANKLKLRCI